MKKGISVIILTLFLLIIVWQSIINVSADSEYTVTQAKAVLYSVGNGNTSVYTKPDFSSQTVTSLGENLPVNVSGVTSNGWFQVDLQGTYFIPGNGLKGKSSSTVSGEQPAPVVSIEQLTKGTFAFYSNKQLRSFTKEEIDEMDENTYIRYLDSFLIGKAMVDYCIVRENGLLLKTHYDGLSAADESVKSMSMKDYLLKYRNTYLDESLKGPVRNEKALKQVLTRAIRYEKKAFKTVYKNVAIGSNQEQMDELLKNIIDTIRYEQGIIYSYTLEYGTYKTSTGKDSTGWVISFSY